MHLINLAARFGLELVGIGAVGLWAASLANGLPMRVALGTLAAVALVVVWALVVAPKAANPIPQDVRVVLGSGLLLLAAGALALAGHHELAAAFALAIVLNTILLYALPDGMPAALAARATPRT